jgi:hypothetical protein
VVNEPSYQSLIKLYADMNAIKSIDIFEGENHQSLNNISVYAA